jgi:putative PEP-CTERM system TPR-repeat lipoprotein
MALANLSLRDRNEKAYVDWLEKAATAHPQSVEPRVALARYQLSKGDKNKALATAREAVNAQPDNPAALDLLGTTQLALGDQTNAIASFGKLVVRQPGQPLLLMKLASAQIVAKDFVAARKILQDTLRLQPDFLEAQLVLGSIEIQGKRFEEANKLARQIQQQKPGKAAGLSLQGNAAFAAGDYPGALAAFERAHALEPSGSLLIRQYQVFNATQRAEIGEKRLASWLATHPQDASVRAALAESLLKRGQYAAAVDHYLILNKSNPGNLLVLNNLAWALSELNDQHALTYAEQALKLKPDNPAAMDTLGWILVRQGQAERGIKLLKQALSKAPDSAEIQWHLVVAYTKTGDRVRARNELDRLLASGLAFPQEQDAHALLDQLQGKAR